MKKLKLFFAAAAAMIGLSSNAADTWTGNAPQAGNFYIYNVGGDGFIDGGNSWGTQATLAEIGINCALVDKDGGFSISTNANYANCFLGVNGYIDRPSGEACGWVFTAVAGLTNTYTMSFEGKYLYWPGNGTALLVGDTAPTDSKGYFKLVSATDRYNMISQATKTSSVDVSYMLGNADFGRNSTISMWQGEPAPSIGGPNEDFVGEHFNRTFNNSQTIDVPNGTYVASVCGYYRAGDYAKLDATTQNAIFYVNSTEKPLLNIFSEAKPSSIAGWATNTELGYIPNNMTQASQCFNAGGYAANKLYVTITDGKMTIGLKKEVGITNDWTCFDKIRIRYYGDCTIADVLGLELGELIATAKKVANPTNCLTQAIAAAESVMTTGTQEEEFSDAYSLLDAAIKYDEALAAAKAAKDDPANAKVNGEELTALNEAIAATPNTTLEDIKAKTDALKGATTTFTNAATAYNTFYAYKAETAASFGDEMANSVANPTSAAKANEGIQQLNLAQFNKVKNDYTFSCSGLIGDFGSWTGTATVNGEAATPNYLSNEHWSGQTHAYYEQASNGWGSDAWTIKYEKKCTLPAGDYVLKVASRASEGTTGTMSCSATDVSIALPNFGNRGYGISTSGEATWAEDAEYACGNAGYGWQWRFLPFTLAEEGEVTMTFYAEANSRYQWMSISDGELLSATKLAQDIVYDETKDNEIKNTIIADVTIKRNIVEGYNTVVLPFLLTANQVKEAFGNDAQVYNFSETSEDKTNVTVEFKKGDGSIAANTPVLVKCSEASTEQLFEGVQIVEGTPVIAGTNYSLTGIYSPKKLTGFDYIVNADGLAVSSKLATINGFCAYLKINSGAGRITHTIIDGEEVTTGINGLFIENSNNGKLYNLNGQEVKDARKGLYIQNGKKVIVK